MPKPNEFFQLQQAVKSLVERLASQSKPPEVAHQANQDVSRDDSRDDSLSKTAKSDRRHSRHDMSESDSYLSHTYMYQSLACETALNTECPIRGVSGLALEESKMHTFSRI